MIKLTRLTKTFSLAVAAFWFMGGGRYRFMARDNKLTGKRRARTASGVIMATADLIIVLPIIVAGVALICDFG